MLDAISFRIIIYYRNSKSGLQLKNLKIVNLILSTWTITKTPKVTTKSKVDGNLSLIEQTLFVDHRDR